MTIPKKWRLPTKLTPRERRILSVVRRVVRDVAGDHGALEPGDNRNDDDPSARNAEKVRDSILWYLNWKPETRKGR